MPVQIDMTNTTAPIHAVGVEWELIIQNGDVSSVQAAMNDAGLQFIYIKTDGSVYPNTRPDRDGNVGGDGIEVVFPPMVIDTDFIQTLSRVEAVLNSFQPYTNKKCGMHVHVSNSPVKAGQVCAFNAASKRLRHGEYLSQTPAINDVWFNDPINSLLVWDVCCRYAMNQTRINNHLAKSRWTGWQRNSSNYGHYCLPFNKVGHDALLNLSDPSIDETRNCIQDNQHSGRYNAVNLSCWGRSTIEFRQHQGTFDATKTAQWCSLLHQLFTWSHTERMAVSEDRTIETPEMPFRRSRTSHNGLNRAGVLYRLIRQQGGMQTIEIMNELGCSANNVRTMISEAIKPRLIREGARSGFDVNDVLIRHQQQHFGRSYGDGDQYNGYEILKTVNITGSYGLLPENRIGTHGIFSGISDNDFSFWEARAYQLGHNLRSWSCWDGLTR